jgi:GTP-binding protein HflX
MVFNKIDQLNGNRDSLTRFQERHPHGVAISASNGEGIPALLEELGTQLRPLRDFIELSVPHDQASVIARLHEVGQVIERNYKGKTARFKVRIPPHVREEFAPYLVRKLQTA